MASFPPPVIVGRGYEDSVLHELHRLLKLLDSHQVIIRELPLNMVSQYEYKRLHTRDHPRFSEAFHAVFSGTFIYCYEQPVLNFAYLPSTEMDRAIELLTLSKTVRAEIGQGALIVREPDLDDSMDIGAVNKEVLGAEGTAVLLAKIISTRQEKTHLRWDYRHKEQLYVWHWCHCSEARGDGSICGESPVRTAVLLCRQQVKKRRQEDKEQAIPIKQEEQGGDSFAIKAALANTPVAAPVTFGLPVYAVAAQQQQPVAQAPQAPPQPVLQPPTQTAVRAAAPQQQQASEQLRASSRGPPSI